MLLARSALERGEDTVALAHALAAPRGRDAEEEGERLYLLASAYDRLDSLDTAAAAYQRAAAVLPALSDWMLLKAAAVTADSAARFAIYQRINQPFQCMRAWLYIYAQTKFLDRLSRDWADAGDAYILAQLEAVSSFLQPRREVVHG